MNVYRIEPDVAYGLLCLIGDDDAIETWNQADGKPSAATWHIPTVENPPEYEEVVPVDCLCSATSPGRGMLLNQRAREALASLLLPCGEFLPVRFGDFDYQWFNCTTMVDAADQQRIEGTQYDSPHLPPGRWMEITRWAFHADRVAEAPTVFGVPQRRATVLLCTDVLKQAVEAHDLLGFQFEHLWSSETGGIEIDPSPGRFFGEAGRALDAIGRRKRDAALARLAAR